MMEYQLNAVYDEQQAVWQVRPEGEVDIFNSAAFRNALIALGTIKPADIVINCEALKYIDSTGLGALVEVLKSVKADGSNITLHKLRPHLAKLFKITNLDKTFIIGGDAHE